MATTPRAVDLRTGPRELLTRFLDAWNAHDVNGILSCLHPDVVWEEPGHVGPLHGKAAVAVAMRDTFTALPDLHFPIEDMHVFVDDDGTRGATGFTMTGTMSGPMAMGYAPTGRHLRVTGACLYEFRDGLISRHVIAYDTAAAMQQLGLLPDYGSRAFTRLTRLQRMGVRFRRLLRRR
jgi:steroid delta-isomerase-like uncharacterized protein